MSTPCLPRLHLISKNTSHLRERTSLLRIFDCPLHSIIDVVDNDRRFVSRFAALVNAGAEENTLPFAAKGRFVRIAAEDITFCSNISVSTYPHSKQEDEDCQ